MIFNPHKLGIHKVLKHIPLNAIFDAPYKAAVKRAVNIADLRTIAKSRAHKVSFVLSSIHSLLLEKQPGIAHCYVWVGLNQGMTRTVTGRSSPAKPVSRTLGSPRNGHHII